jgi:PAS domain S-box-containing protein
VTSLRQPSLRDRAEKRLSKGGAITSEISNALSPSAFAATLHDLQVHQIELEIQNEELREVQGELEAARVRYFDLYDLAPVGYLTINDQGALLELNLAASSMLGVPKRSLFGRLFSSFVIREDQDRYYLFYKKLLADGQPLDCGDLRMVRHDGTKFWGHLRGVVATDAAGATVSHFIIEDVAARKENEKQLALANTAMKAAADGIVITDRSGAIVWVNPAFTKLTGYSATEALGKNPRILKSGQHPEEFYKQIWRTITLGLTWHDTIVNRHKDGRLYKEELTITPVCATPAGDITHFVAIKRDIATRQLVENPAPDSANHPERAPAPVE